MSGSGSLPPAPDHGLVGLDADGRVIGLSAAACELLGVVPDQVVDRPLALALTGPDGDRSR
ncbi:PAS domain-containing protein [Nocardioides taihuensis]|uniref:PAS domain-containing protein n=1 Tax=Nocardioides taihuensis TaxID=1835606 RepID=A0ABW0BN18_9ACTN